MGFDLEIDKKDEICLRKRVRGFLRIYDSRIRVQSFEEFSMNKTILDSISELPVKSLYINLLFQN